MYLDFNVIYDELSKIPAFKILDLQVLSKIFPYFYQREYSRGSHVYYMGDKADNLYILVEGKIRLESYNKAITYYDKEIGKKNWIIGKPVYDELEKGIFGEEIAIGKDSKYNSNAYVTKDAKVIILPRKVFNQLLSKNQEFVKMIMDSMVNHFIFDKGSKSEDTAEVEEKKAKKEETSEVDIFNLFSWILVIITPLIIYNFSSYFDLDWRTKNFFIILAVTVLIWIFRLLPDFVANIFAMVSIVILDIVPLQVAFSGFTSGSFHMAMSVFGMSILFLHSGLSYRAVLYILKIIPNSQIFYNIFIFLFCFVIVPIFPSANGRLILMGPIMIDILQSLGYKKKGRASHLIVNVVLNGLTLLSSVFLSSKLIHFVIYGLLSRQTAEFFNWGNWFIASIGFLISVVVIFFLLLTLFYKNNEQATISKSVVNYQLKILGPMNYGEYGALFSIIFFMLGILTISYHKISISWIGMVVLFILLSLKFLSKKNFQMKIDWAFLVYLATLLGIVKVMSFLNLNKYVLMLFNFFPFYYITFFLENYFILYIVSMAVFIFSFDFLFLQMQYLYCLYQYSFLYLSNME